MPLEEPSRDAVWLAAGEFVPRFASTVGRAHVAFHPLAVKRAHIEEKAFFNKRLVQVRRKLLDEAKEVLVFQLVLFGATTVLFDWARGVVTCVNNDRRHHSLGVDLVDLRLFLFRALLFSWLRLLIGGNVLVAVKHLLVAVPLYVGPEATGCELRVLL